MLTSWALGYHYHYETFITHLVQNIFDKDPSHRIISLDATYIVLFKNHRDMGFPLRQASLSQWQWHLDGRLFGCHSHVYSQLCGHRFQPVDAQKMLPVQHAVPQRGHSGGGNLVAKLQGMREYKGPSWDSSAPISQHAITMAGVCHHHSHSHDDDEDYPPYYG